jgi:histidinol-phosphatase
MKEGNLNLQKYLDFAVQTAFDAGRLTLGHFQTGIQAEYKSDNSPVTIADKEAEELIRSRIEKKFPTHDILGEEFGHNDSGAAFKWIVDPIDGTKSFIKGIPLYSVLVGLEIEGTCEVGAVYFPALGDMVYAANGCGCYWNGKRTHVSQTKELSDSFVSYSDIFNMEKYGKTKRWDKILNATYYRGGWPDAYGHALVATGRLEIMLDPVINDWDCGPFPPILKEAGGYFGDWHGNETIYAEEAISTTQVLLPKLLALIND